MVLRTSFLFSELTWLRMMNASSSFIFSSPLSELATLAPTTTTSARKSPSFDCFNHSRDFSNCSSSLTTPSPRAHNSSYLRTMVSAASMLSSASRKSSARSTAVSTFKLTCRNKVIFSSEPGSELSLLIVVTCSASNLAARFFISSLADTTNLLLTEVMALPSLVFSVSILSTTRARLALSSFRLISSTPRQSSWIQSPVAAS